MSSRFVSGGTTDAPIDRDEAWQAAQEELDAKHRRRVEEAQQPPQKSLYDALQANRAAKEDAFAEAAKLKNQFRALDEDEVEFLDSVLQSTRAEEERVKRETAEGLQAFRRQQEEADKKLRASEAEGDQSAVGEPETHHEQSWTMAPRKRKRTKEKEGIKGLKLRKASTSESEPVSEKGKAEVPSTDIEEKDASVRGASSADETISPPESSRTSVQSVPNNMHKTGASDSRQSKAGGLSLVDYGSDDD